MKASSSIKALALALWLASTGAAQQQEEKKEEDEPDELRIEEVVTVTATRGGERSAADAPVSVSVVTEDQIERSPGTTIDELLRLVPSVQLPLQNSNSYFPVIPSVAIRGLGLGDGTTRTLVLQDGLPMNGAFFANVFWNRVPKHNVERIEIVRGASSSLFGSYAMGGVVNVITRTPSPRTARFDARFGSNTTYQLDGYASHVTERGLEVSGNFDYFQTDGYYELAEEDRGPIDRRAAVEDTVLQGKIGYRLGDGERVFFRTDYYKQDQEGGTFLSRTATEVWDLAGGIDKKVGEGLVTAALYYVDEEFQTDNIATRPFGTRESEFVSNAHITPAEDVGGSLQYSLTPGATVPRLTFGVDFRRLEGYDDADIFENPGELAFEKYGAGKQRSIGIFGEVTWKPTSRLEILGSLRQDYFRNYDGIDTTAGVTTEFEAKTFDQLDPRVAARYQLVPELALRGAVYRGFRAPTLAELYRAFGSASFQGLPNAELEPETLVGGEIGVDITPRGFPLYSQVNYFHNEAENLVGGVVVAFDPIFTLMNQNLGKIRSRGFEWINQLRLHRAWSATVNYTYTDSEITENIDDPTLVGNHVEGTPPNYFSFGVTYSEPSRPTVTFRGRYVDEQYQDATNETYVPSSTVFDLFASYPLKDEVELYFIAENVFDAEVIAEAFGGLNTLAAPRQFFAGVRLRMN
jgi:outer membrane receptor protein involved in Fe transport